MAEQRCARCGAAWAGTEVRCPVCGWRRRAWVEDTGAAARAAHAEMDSGPPRLGGRALLLALDGALLFGALLLGVWLFLGGTGAPPGRSTPSAVTPGATLSVPLLATPTARATPRPTPSATAPGVGSGLPPTVPPTATHAPRPTPTLRPTPTPTPTIPPGR